MGAAKRQNLDAAVGMRLPKKLLRDVETIAKRENPEGDLPISWFLRRAISEYVERHLGKGKRRG